MTGFTPPPWAVAATGLHSLELFGDKGAQMQSIIGKLKVRLFWSGLVTAGVVWAVTLYWTLVSHGYLDTPWSV